MKVNDYYQTNKIIFYNNTNGEQTERIINPYNTKTFFNSVNIYGDTYLNSSDYFNIIIEELKPVKNQDTHINASKRRNDYFIVLEKGTLQGVLYLPLSVVKEWTTKERKEERPSASGCVCVSYDDYLIFNKEIKITTKDTKVFFARGSDPIDRNYREDLQNIDDELQKAREHESLFKSDKIREAKKRYIALLEQKKKDGFDYIVYQYRCISVITDNLTFYNCVDHYEKSKDYIAAEKLTEEIKKICGSWYISNTLELLKSYKITKKRK